MIGRFLFGAFSGVVLVVSGMIAGSALFPLRGPSEMPPEGAVTPTVTEGTEAAAPEAEPVVVAEAEAPAVEPEPTEAAPEPAPVEEPATQPEIAEAPAALPEPPVEAGAEALATETVAVAEVEAPATPEAPATLPAPSEDPTVVAAESGATAVVPEPTPEPAADPTPEPAPAEASTAEVVAEPTDAVLPAATAEPEAGTVADTVAEPEPTAEPATEPAPEPATEAQPEPVTEPEVPAEEAPEDGETKSSTFEPAKGFASEATITADSETAAATDETAAETAAAEAASTRPMALFAAKFDNPEAKPVLAIVLIDTGAADLDRAALAALPFPVSFALDPMDPATPDHAAIYRAAGREVIMLATGIAEGSQASDIEVAFQSMSQRMPEAVAVMDLSDPVFQDNRPLASLVVPVIGGEGRGVLSWDKGLNAADQVARRDDIASAVIFRDLATGGGDAGATKRTLDRAVFKAGQDGRVVVAGEVTPELIAGLLEWSVEGRAGAVALGPLTAVLQID